MPDLAFAIEAVATGAGKEREGTLTVGGQQIPFSVPASMGGKGMGASSETLLVSAVTACYCLTLLYFLQRMKLPVGQLTVHTEGLVTGFPHDERYARITVNPTIHGGDPAREGEYRAAVVTAPDRCFIGQTVAAGGLAYEVGSIGFAD